MDIANVSSALNTVSSYNIGTSVGPTTLPEVMSVAVLDMTMELNEQLNASMIKMMVVADKLNEIGIALDFKLLKAAVDEVIERYDHRNLSELPEFQEINPTSEVLAQTIYRTLAGRLNKDGIKIARVSIAESSASRVIYSE